MILKSLKDGRKDGRAADGRTVGRLDGQSGSPKKQYEVPPMGGMFGGGEDSQWIFGDGTISGDGQGWVDSLHIVETEIRLFPKNHDFSKKAARRAT